MNKPILSLLCLFALTAIGFAQTEPTLFQKPTVNRTHIVFAYGGDLWIVPREGGDAKRLTNGVGEETSPFFSPDGSMVAFTAQYDGNTDVYVVPAAGGVPKRLTFHPGGDDVVGWTNDGKRVVFNSMRGSGSFYPRLFTIGVDGAKDAAKDVAKDAGGLPEEIPLPQAERGSFSPDAAFIAYQPLRQSQPDWKRYRGGQAMPIWIARLGDSTIEKIPRDNSNDKYPMWIGERIYFLSDRNGPMTLFAFDTKSKKVTQMIPNNGLDIKWATAGVGGSNVIAYEQFGSIYLFDLKSNKSQKVNIRVSADQLSVRPRFEKVGARIFNSAISPTGARAVFEARGEIITVPAEKGDPRNLTGTTGVMERSPAWSPDGKWIAYFSDESGEYALHLRDQKGVGEVKKIKLPPAFYYAPAWSPDSKKIVFQDKFHNLFFVEVEKGDPVKVAANPIGGPARTLFPAWSPDSKWIAYTKHLSNRLRAVFVYSLETGKSTQITDGMSDALYADFDRNGKYLYFTASTNIGPAVSFADLSSIAHQPTRSVYAMVLGNDQPSPLAPESDEEKVQEVKNEEKKDDKPADKPEEKKADEKKPDAPKPPAKKEPDPVRIDFEGIDQRIIALPIPTRNFAGLYTGKANIIYLLEVPPAGGAGPLGFTLHKFDLEKRKFDKALDGIGSFEVSANGEKVLYQQGQNWIIAPAATLGGPGGGGPPAGLPAGVPGGLPGVAPGGGPSGPNILKIAEMEVYVDPKVEWKQMYHEAWRNERDFFYDPGLHGVDLPAFKKMYEAYLPSVAHRSDLNYLFTEMMNQLTVGHMFIGGGDIPRPNFVGGGLLGCDYKVENGRHRFARVFNGENWNPQLRAPLTQPGVNVKAGEYLLAVNGRNLTANDNVYQFFESTANKQVVIKAGPNADGSNSREVTVVPVGNEMGLRNLAWIEGNRRKVAELSGGKLAYVYMPDTAFGGYTSFQRYFFAQTDKEGALIDERFNGGGLLSDYVVEHLTRRLLNRIAFREGEDWNTPAGAIYGPKAMLINESAGSGGDALPWYFKNLKIGPLVGKRTWGGLVGVNGTPPLMDGGFVAAPSSALYGLDGEWEVENIGVGPDIEVDFDPAAWRQGRDPQLEKAVQYLMDEVKKNPQPKYKRPPYPNYSFQEKEKNHEETKSTKKEQKAQ